jgi:hypothetical protein
MPKQNHRVEQVESSPNPLVGMILNWLITAGTPKNITFKMQY